MLFRSLPISIPNRPNDEPEPSRAQLVANRILRVKERVERVVAEKARGEGGERGRRDGLDFDRGEGKEGRTRWSERGSERSFSGGEEGDLDRGESAARTKLLRRVRVDRNPVRREDGFRWRVDGEAWGAGGGEDSRRGGSGVGVEHFDVERGGKGWGQGRHGEGGEGVGTAGESGRSRRRRRRPHERSGAVRVANEGCGRGREAIDGR